MAIFNSYVKLPEGKLTISQSGLREVLQSWMDWVDLDWQYGVQELGDSAN